MMPCCVRSPSDVEARCGLARSLAQQGDRAGALREYSRVLSDRPEYPDALNNMGIIEEDLGQYDAAIDLFTLQSESRPIQRRRGSTWRISIFNLVD